jgi:hypothetical protein
MLMPDIDEIKKTWTMPDEWTICMKEKSMEVFDSSDDMVAKALNQISVIEALQQHIEAKESAVAYQLLMATLKKPVDA